MYIDLYSKKRLLCKSKQFSLFYHRGNLLLILNSSSKQISKIKLGGFLSRFVLLSRLLRLEPRASICIDDVFLISFNGKIFRYEPDHNKLIVEHYFSKKMKNPLNFCLGLNDKGEECVLYGEYIWNQTKGPVSLYSRDSLAKWEKVYEFNSNTITHIHNIIFDRDSLSYFILTGDEDNESGIWQADLSFSNVTPILIGKQKYRSCVGCAQKGGFLYATDTPIENNYFYSFNDKGRMVSEVKGLCGPVIYGIFNNGKLFFSTSVEPDSTLNKLCYRLTNRLGKGVLDRYSHIYCYFNGEVIEIGRFKKDHFPIWLFGFGTCYFPYCATEEVFVVLQACLPKHDHTYLIKDGD